MFKGFYNLTSAMLMQSKNLDVIGNNMANVSSTGYKADRYVDTTFDEVMRARIGNVKKAPVPLGTTTSYISTMADTLTDHTGGALYETELPLDFAIDGEGFFAIQTENNGILYTRNGSFQLDDQGYLYLPMQGRVLNQNGQPILLGTDQIMMDNQGGLYHEVTGQEYGRLGVFAFDDPRNQLDKINEGMYEVVDNAQPRAPVNMVMHHKRIERSNVDMAQQMADLIASQRALQSAAQVTKMYDNLMSKVTTELGRA